MNMATPTGHPPLPIHPARPIQLEAVSKRFGKTCALQQLTATLLPGQLTGLAGPDGAGKTTLIRLMTGLMQPDSGSINMAGLDSIRDKDRIAEQVGYMPQRFGLYEDLSVLENLKLYAGLRGIDPQTRGENFTRLLEFTRLAPFTDRLAGRLSGGMKQKLGLACALMGQPKILLLDEPGVGVDPVSRQDLWRMVHALTSQGMAVLWATAYLDEAERCQSVLLLNEGRLVFHGPPENLTRQLAGRTFSLSRPGHPSHNPRALLSRALDLESVCDGVIQGQSIRIVLRRDQPPSDITAFAQSEQAILSPVPPRFEDAFIDLLGGGPGGTSALAERMPEVPEEEKANPKVIVRCQQLTRLFGKFVASDKVSFEVKRGEIFGLLGPNGAGKSTTFKMLCGLLQPTSGQAEVLGFNLRQAPTQAKRQLGYMAQKFSLYGLLSVRQNLNFSAGVYGLEGPLKKQRIEEMIDTFQLAPYLDHSPDQLPLGFKQRLALACAVMHRPPVLFLDEPTSGVDPVTRREFWTHINGLVLKGVTVLVTTHFMDEAEYCDRVALMDRARLIALDTPDQLKARAATPACPAPGMEEAFIYLIEKENQQHPATPNTEKVQTVQTGKADSP